MIDVDAHPHLDLIAFASTFTRPLGELDVPQWLCDLLRLDASAPFHTDDSVRDHIRKLLRHGGYKPTGRGKPAFEYLLRAAGDGSLSSINLAVDACNAVSLHSGIPISVIDLDRASPPFRVTIAPEGSSYVFNQTGQSIDLSGLLCLFDHEGACANAVKDAQRTKTSSTTTRTLSLLWGSRSLPDRTERAYEWYQKLLSDAGASIERCTLNPRE